MNHLRNSTFGKRLRAAQQQEEENPTPESDDTREYGDRFIPTRDRGDMRTSYNLKDDSTPSTPSKKSRIIPSESDALKEQANALFNSILHTEVTPADPPSPPRPPPPIAAAPSTPTRRRLFVYNSPSASAPSTPTRRLDTTADSAYSMSPTPYRVLDAPELAEDFYLNLVDWSSTNVLGVGLGSCVYLWTAHNAAVNRLCDLSDTNDSISSVSWVQKGSTLAVGTLSGRLHVYDANRITLLRTYTQAHTQRIGAIAWNAHVLSSGSRDRIIHHRDVRESATRPFKRSAGHRQEVCGLKWSGDGGVGAANLASGGNDNKVCIWDLRGSKRSNSASRATTVPEPDDGDTPLWKFHEHTAAVKALAWDPHISGVLATGGGTQDKHIRFWNTISGAMLNELDTGSQVCNLIWSLTSHELVSTHGFSSTTAQNQICIWKYPTLNMVASLTGHTNRVLYLAMSPDGETIVTGAGDETLRFWNAFPKRESHFCHTHPFPSILSSMAALDPEDVPTMQRAVRQIEFYFADSNLPYDKFMWTLHSKTPEHWVSLATVASFKRMREFTPLGVEWVARALREQSTQLEVDADGTNVRRKTEVQEPKDQFERSVYAKGFPEENDTLQARLEAFFEQYGPTNAVRMRRDQDKKFKLSVFAEFSSMDTCTAFLSADPPPTFEGTPLLVMSKEAYCQMKIKEKGLTGKAADSRRNLYTPGRKFDAFRDAASKMDVDTKPAAETATAPQQVFLEFMGSTIAIHRNEEGVGAVNDADVPFVKGATLRFDGAEEGGKVMFTDIKLPLKEKFGRPPFIKYTTGASFGLVGFHKALTEDDIKFVKEAIPKLGNNEITWTVAGEEEEKEFQLERAQSAARMAWEQASGMGKEKGGRGGRGGRGGGRGGRDSGGRGGRGRGRGRGGRREGGRDARPAEDVRATENTGAEDAPTGEKRKRAVEPDGGPDVGVRGKAAPPTIASVKKAKTEE
ncbi:WD-REPEATS-REGION domain-containing protein [Mycena indigotica]|uniref:WD-REPEATS-REGION domain-containing protein n=1 Tax=Mycena indigotica TaxID=2126181 RepID=A0A8H6SBE7_9AGAR|nr:WD-REPEATS-REGION domain-containing protein [Mycena indigotica]KAF7295227.1 WD-REPEATS-REGION domain-containing protein [Mycena indigotica]